MEKWVISPFLTEKHIRILNDEKLLHDFAICARPVIITSILDYVNSNGCNEEIKDMLLNVFESRIAFMDVQKDDVILDNVDKVYGYTFDSVHAGLSIPELEAMRDTIGAVYNDDYNVPYINVIPGDIIANIINNLLALNRVNKNMEYKKLAYLLSKNKELFKDKPNANAKGTVFKTVAKRSTELDIIQRGIEFLLKQKREGKQPESWRIY